MGKAHHVALVALQSMIVRQLDSTQSSAPGRYSASLFFQPRPHEWWRTSFDDHFSGGYRSIEWTNETKAKIECSFDEIGVVFAALACANRDWKTYAPSLEQWDRDYDAFSRGEVVDQGVELVELIFDRDGKDGHTPGAGAGDNPSAPDAVQQPPRPRSKND